MDNTQDFTYIEFCTGYAGLSAGIHSALKGLRPLAYCERDFYASSNLSSKMEQNRIMSAPIWTDVKTFPGESFRGKVDLLMASYPCQPMSSAGKRKGQDDIRYLWPYIRRQINIIQPGWVFFENVEGHITLGLSSVISDLAEDGYRATFGIFSASEVGAPHHRKRVFILAYKEGWRLPKLKEDSTRYLWPSRPGDPQHCWEKERVVGYSKKQSRNGDANYKESCSGSFFAPSEFRNTDDNSAWRNGGCGESEMGGTTDGSFLSVGNATGSITDFGHRIDELKLLGNGVVPATVEKAWRTLFNRLLTGDTK